MVGLISNVVLGAARLTPSVSNSIITLDGYQVTPDRLGISVARGEVESASVIATTGQDHRGVLLKIKTPVMTNGEAEIAEVDVRVVRPWYQAGGGGRMAPERNDGIPHLVSELLVYDWDLVRTDAKREVNLLRLGTAPKARYVSVSQTARTRSEYILLSKDWPVVDASVLQPLDLLAGKSGASTG